MDLYNMLLAKKLSGGGGGDTFTLVDKTISANGTYNASSDDADGYKKVVVDVPNSYDSGDEGKVVSNGALVAQTSATKTENGTYDTTLNNSVTVNVPLPTGTISITENGTVDVTQYASADVNVSGGGGSDAEDGIIARTISGAYNNSRVTEIGSYAFAYCNDLTDVNFQNVLSIAQYAFWRCSALTSVSFPNVTDVGSSAFINCSALTDVDFQNATEVYSYAFMNCTALTNASFPKANEVRVSLFSNCYALTNVSFPNATNIANSAFTNCSALANVSFPKATRIGNSAFYNCINLMSAYFLAQSIVTLNNVTAFFNTPMSNSAYTGSFGSIYVPASLVSDYKVATNWSVYADRITSYVE